MYRLCELLTTNLRSILCPLELVLEAWISEHDPLWQDAQFIVTTRFPDPLTEDEYPLNVGVYDDQSVAGGGGDGGGGGGGDGFDAAHSLCSVPEPYAVNNSV